MSPPVVIAVWPSHASERRNNLNHICETIEIYLNARIPTSTRIIRPGAENLSIKLLAKTLQKKKISKKNALEFILVTDDEAVTQNMWTALPKNMTIRRAFVLTLAQSLAQSGNIVDRGRKHSQFCHKFLSLSYDSSLVIWGTPPIGEDTKHANHITCANIVNNGTLVGESLTWPDNAKVNTFYVNQDNIESALLLIFGSLCTDVPIDADVQSSSQASGTSPIISHANDESSDVDGRSTIKPIGWKSVVGKYTAQRTTRWGDIWTITAVISIKDEDKQTVNVATSGKFFALTEECFFSATVSEISHNEFLITSKESDPEYTDDKKNLFKSCTERGYGSYMGGATVERRQKSKSTKPIDSTDLNEQPLKRVEFKQTNNELSVLLRATPLAGDFAATLYRQSSK